ncbi:hypothetical protein [Nocardiopsis sp. EMB25]|nr:hypothetical protein [Nocardiopsis sp. EMB25]
MRRDSDPQHRILLACFSTPSTGGRLILLLVLPTPLVPPPL